MAQDMLRLYAGNAKPPDTDRHLGQVKFFRRRQVICPEGPKPRNFIYRLTQSACQPDRPAHQFLPRFSHLQPGNVKGRQQQLIGARGLQQACRFADAPQVHPSAAHQQHGCLGHGA